MTTIDARLNPAAAQAALDQALSEPEPSAAPASTMPEVEDAPDTSVTLVAGWYDRANELHTDAEVRELTGADEEALAKVKGNAKLLQTILERGTVRVGPEKATTAILDSLLVGDQTALLLAIRSATFGADVELEVICPHCSERQQTTVNLTKDVPVTPLEGYRDFDVTLKVGTARVFLPTGKVQKKVIAAGDKTGAELNTLLLAECVHDIAGVPVTPERIRALSMRDRQALLTELASRLIGPRLEEVSLPCQSCSEDIALPLDMADLFRL